MKEPTIEDIKRAHKIWHKKWSGPITKEEKELFDSLAPFDCMGIVMDHLSRAEALLERASKISPAYAVEWSNWLKDYEELRKG